MNNNQILQLMANSGRANDSLVAHLSPDSINILKNDGGLGTTNPETGLQEFWGWSDFVQVFTPVVFIAVAVFVPELIPAIGAELGFAAGSVEAAAAGSAALGASAGAVNSIASGGNPEQVIKSAGIGAVAGAAGGAVGAEVGGGITGATAGGAASGATSAGLSGGDIAKGAATGAIGGAISSGVTSGLQSTFGGQAPEARVGQGQAYGPATADYPFGTRIQPTAPYLADMGGSGVTQTTPQGTYTSSGFVPAGSFNAEYPIQNYTPTSGYSVSGDIASLSPTDSPTTTQKTLGSLTSQLLTPSIINSLYPTGSTDRGATTASIGGGGGSGGSSGSGAVLGSGSAPNPNQAPILGTTDKVKPVWNEESLKSALGI